MKNLRLRPVSSLGIYIVAAVALILFVAPCRADVLFIHDYDVREYLLGEQKAELLVGYTDRAMFSDKKIKYTGKMMKRLYGKVKEGRDTTLFLLDKDQIHEIDYHKGKIIVFPFEKLTDISWIKLKEKPDEAVAEMIRERYRILKPTLSINILPEKEKVNGYLCKLVEADLRLETVDVKKKSSSVTLINQKLWLSDTVPGYGEYCAFHKKLAKRLGLDAARLGSLSYLLRYWDGTLDPLRKSLKKVEGYPVKIITTVEGSYTAGIDTDSPKTSSMKIKEEVVLLKDVILEVDESLFVVQNPSEFGVVVVE